MFKKLVVYSLAMAMMSAHAKDMTVVFKDGTAHDYTNVPDKVTKSMVADRAAKDFPGRAVERVDGDENFWDTTTGNVVYVVALVAGVAVIGHLASKAFPAGGKCNVPSDIAADGSRCGNRAASVRPGGA